MIILYALAGGGIAYLVSKRFRLSKVEKDMKKRLEQIYENDEHLFV